MTDDKDNIQLSAVEDHDGILTIRGGGARRDWNGIHYKQGMAELGLDISREFPKRLTTDQVQAADVVITMGWRTGTEK